MKNLFLAFIISPIFVFAQKSIIPQKENMLLLEITGKPEISNFQKTVFNASSLEKSVNEHLLQFVEMQNPDCELRLMTKNESPVGIHLFYQQFYKGLAVYGSYIKVNLNKNGEQLSSFNHLYQSQNWNSIVHTNDASKGEAMFIVSNEKLVAAYKKTVNGIETISDKNAAILMQQDLKLYYTNDDTLVTTKVFMPDPLTTAQVAYGKNGTYMHFNDSDYALLNDQRFPATFPATLEGDTFRLKNKYCRIVDMQPPQTKDATPINFPSRSVTPDFSFMRGKNGFKDAMVMFHIYNYQQYLNSIGIHNAVNWQIKIDPFGLEADNSFFLPDIDTAIYFGLGGVPDAEDADVIIHEYTHAIRYSFSPESPVGADRWAVEEGIGDIMAALYSRAYSDYQWKNLYNWDGHNQFWDGRDGNTINVKLGRMKKYSDKTGDKYFDSEIWTACILDMYDEIGREVITKLMLNTIYSLTPNTTMPETAKLFMQSDSLLFGKSHAWKIGKYFNQRELGSFSSGINDITNQPTFKVLNTAGFADGSGDAVIETMIPSTVSVFALNGQKISETINATDKITLQTSQFQKGFYFIRIENTNGIFTFKMIKL